jgi:hypothetical protein
MMTFAFSPKRQHGIVAGRDFETAIDPGAKLIRQMDKRPNNRRGDSVAGDDLCLVLDLVDDAHRRGIIGRLGNDREANDEK